MSNTAPTATPQPFGQRAIGPSPGTGAPFGPAVPLGVTTGRLDRGMIVAEGVSSRATRVYRAVGVPTPLAGGAPGVPVPLPVAPPGVAAGPGDPT
jgi:hypothetical protein